MKKQEEIAKKIAYAHYNGSFGRQDRRLDPWTRNMSAVQDVSFTPVKSQADELAAAIQQNSGVIDVSGGKVIDFMPAPTSFTVTVTSAAGGSDATINIFNNTALTALTTTNGGGANTVTYSWGDGFLGRVYEQFFKISNGGKGIRFNGFSLLVTVLSTGAQTASYFNTMQLKQNIANGMNGLVPFNVDLSEATRNTQQQIGLLTLRKPQFVSALGQLQYTQPTNTVFSWTFFTNASSFMGVN